jgi:hypothetical protein
MIDDLLGKLVADKYRIQSVIGESDEGELFAGSNEIMDKPVTVKTLPRALSMDARWTKRFIDESRAASLVSHPNILNLTDFGSDTRGVAYAVYEPIDGTQLSELLTTALDEKRAIEIARQVAAAVTAAHGKKLVHGRLSPQSIFVTTDDAGIDHVKVYGFGGDPLSIGNDADPRYLAPEQCNAFPVADDRTDVYSLSIVLYEMLSGVLPFEGTTADEVQAKLLSEPPPPLSAFRKDLNPEIEPIILTAMAALPERRYQTMAAFAEDLGLLSSRIAPAKAAAATEGSKHNIWKTATIAFAGIALLAVALIYATSVRKTDPTDQLQADAGSLPVQPIGPATGAQEESLARLPALSDAEIMATTAGPLADTLPGGDGYNAWANGGAPPIGAPPLGAIPPAGAPLNQGVPPVEVIQPGGQTYTVPSSGSGSQFMPQDGGVILVPVPKTPEPTPTPKAPSANTAAPATTTTGPKTLATPIPKNKPAASDPAKGKTTPAKKPGDDLDLKQ